MDIQSMTVDLKFEPRLMVGLLKLCTEALEGAAERVDQLQEQVAHLRETARADDGYRELHDRVTARDRYIEELRSAWPGPMPMPIPLLADGG